MKVTTDMQPQHMTPAGDFGMTSTTLTSIMFGPSPAMAASTPFWLRAE
eukprot:CAMPEP_0180604132 /NCGR_PEP_ID=MMETSP1037_2-20121125/25893_1 /TAXON_ID=632150 /ORGANISM="Azadinium spinosum, Strain 3D9" /LENGTH=47 /DNA_ID= /DNA_START= /DNA_END= /DNA_ORIENTATION=